MAAPQWTMLDKRMTLDMLGFLPDFLNEDDPRSARDQLDLAYAHGGGWHEMKGWKLNAVDPFDVTITYPGDPLLKALATTKLRRERVYFFPHAWVCILQPNGDFSIARMD